MWVEVDEVDAGRHSAAVSAGYMHRASGDALLEDTHDMTREAGGRGARFVKEQGRLQLGGAAGYRCDQLDSGLQGEVRRHRGRSGLLFSDAAAAKHHVCPMHSAHARCASPLSTKVPADSGQPQKR